MISYPLGLFLIVLWHLWMLIKLCNKHKFYLKLFFLNLFNLMGSIWPKNKDKNLPSLKLLELLLKVIEKLSQINLIHKMHKIINLTNPMIEINSFSYYMVWWIIKKIFKDWNKYKLKLNNAHFSQKLISILHKLDLRDILIQVKKRFNLLLDNSKINVLLLIKVNNLRMDLRQNHYQTILIINHHDNI
jgi:hypothetical protein